MTQHDTAPTHQGNGGSDRSIAELVHDATQQTGDLLRKEFELAQLELKAKGRRAGAGAGMFGAAGVLGLGAYGALVAAAVLALATAVDGWLAALIVAVVLGAVAGVLTLRGKKNVEQAVPPVPQQAVDSTQEDLTWIRQSAKR